MKRIFLLIFSLLLLLNCKKQDQWLDVKSNKNDVVPTSLKDYQALLDYDLMNQSGPMLGIISSDNYYVTDGVWSALIDTWQKNSYIWAKDIFSGNLSFDWSYAYQQVGIANVVLDGLQKFEQSTENKNIKGEALFFRAQAFYNLSQLFAKPYNESTANVDLGIVLKLTSQVQEKISRSTNKEVYNRIISDLLEAKDLLPSTSLYTTRPSKPAVLGLLANVYLVMGDYKSALQYSKEAMVIKNTLIDFNTLITSVALPLPNYQKVNPEIIFYNNQGGTTITGTTRLLINQSFFQLYGNNDLRKDIFFNSAVITGIRFKGYYSGETSTFFCGIATNELYLIVSECEARLDNKDEALRILNELLIKRYRTNDFTPIIANNSEEALSLILLERRKELPFTGLTRWNDLRRLNKDPRFAITLSRTVNGINYTLPPNDPRYVFPIPDDEVRINGIQQNQR